MPQRKPNFNECVCNLPQPDHSEGKPSRLFTVNSDSRKEGEKSLVTAEPLVSSSETTIVCIHKGTGAVMSYLRRQAAHPFTTPNFLDFFRYYVHACICKQNIEAAFDSKWILMNV